MLIIDPDQLLSPVRAETQLQSTGLKNYRRLRSLAID